MLFILIHTYIPSIKLFKGFLLIIYFLIETYPNSHPLSFDKSFKIFYVPKY
jgi:hypothetical protein